MPERANDWGRIKELLADALELEPGERDAFLDERCGDDRELRAELDALLGNETTRTGLLDAPPMVDLFAEVPELSDELEGQQIGPYRIVRRIGRGGMGTVYEAEQDSPRRSVAFKVMRGEISSPELRARFRYEAEILGRLQHPAIARIFEASVWEQAPGAPVPYFVMELVNGEPLNQAILARQIDVRGRLELMIKICAGVQHAHHNGVIHRDLKPDNILVDSFGEPRILGFGIARLSDDEHRMTTLNTRVGQVLGTLDYMSPEQVQGDPIQIDTRCDVYALGVILFQVLTGRLPFEFRNSSLPDAIRTILEDSPPLPSRYEPTLRGDLDTIVATATEKDKARRYASASELASDLQRTLNDEPILARRASTIYQLRKFTRRHRGLVGGLATAFVVLVAAVIFTTYLLVQATRARDESQASSAFLTSMLASVDPDVSGRDVTLREFLDRAALEIESSFPEQPHVRRSLHSTLGWTYYRLGDYKAAQRETEMARALYAEGLGPSHEMTLEEQNHLVQILVDSEQFEEAERWLADAEVRGRSLGPKHPVVLGHLRSRASLHLARGKLAESEAAYRELLDYETEVFGAEDETLLGTLNGLAGALLQQGKLEEAERHFRHVFTSREELFGATHPTTVQAGMNVALVLDYRVANAEAETLYRSLLPNAVRAWGEAHTNVWTLKNNLAACLTGRGAFEEAMELSAAALAGYTDAFGPGHSGAVAALNSMTVALMQLGRFEEAEIRCRELYEILLRRHGEEHLETLAVMANLASALSEVGKTEEAEQFNRRTLELRVRILGPGHPSTLISRNNLGVFIKNEGRREEALAIFFENLKLAKESQPDSPLNVLYYQFAIGKTLLELGRLEEAKPWLLPARDVALELLDENHPHRINVLKALKQLEGKPGTAVEEGAAGSVGVE